MAPALRASYALVGSLETPGAHGALTGAYIVLTDGVDEASRERWAAAVLEIGLFTLFSRKVRACELLLGNLSGEGGEEA